MSGLTSGNLLLCLDSLLHGTFMLHDPHPHNLMAGTFQVRSGVAPAQHVCLTCDAAAALLLCCIARRANTNRIS